MWTISGMKVTDLINLIFHILHKYNWKIKNIHAKHIQKKFNCEDLFLYRLKKIIETSRNAISLNKCKKFSPQNQWSHLGHNVGSPVETGPPLHIHKLKVDHTAHTHNTRIHHTLVEHLPIRNLWQFGVHSTKSNWHTSRKCQFHCCSRCVSGAMPSVRLTFVDAGVACMLYGMLFAWNYPGHLSRLSIHVQLTRRYVNCVFGLCAPGNTYWFSVVKSIWNLLFFTQSPFCRARRICQRHSQIFFREFFL